MAGGKLAAYQRLRPLQGDVTSVALDGEDQEFKYRAERRLISDRKKQDEAMTAEAKKAKADDYKEGLDKLSVNTTGYKSHDEAIIDFLQGPEGVYQQYSDLKGKLESNPGDKNTILKLHNLEKSIESIKTLRDGIVQKGQTIADGIADGSLSKSMNIGYANNYENMIKKFAYKFKIDDTGNVLVENLGKADLDGDGFPDEISVNDIFDPTKMGGGVASFDLNKWVTSVKDNYGKKTDDNGITKITGFDLSKVEDLKNDVDQLFGKDVNSMTNQFKAYAGDTLGFNWKDVKTDEEFATIKNKIARKVMNTFENKKEVDQSAKNAQARLAFDRQKEANRSREKSRTGSGGKEESNLRTTVDGIMSGDTQSIEALNNIRVGSTGEKFIEDADYTNGKVVFKIKDRKGGNVEVVSIDTANKETAESKILSYIRPGDDIDKTLGELNSGKSLKNFDKNNNTYPSKAKQDDIIENVPKKATEAIEYLKENDLLGFKDTSGFFSNIITGPNGKEYNLKTDKGKKELSVYLKSMYEESRPKNGKEELNW